MVASLKGMPAKLVSDDGNNIVIRPLAYCAEKDLIKYAEVKNFPIIPCNLCGSQPNLQRQVIKEMLNEWSKISGRIQTMFRAMQNVVPSHLMDTQQFDFVNIQSTGIANPEGILLLIERVLQNLQ